MSRLRKIHLHLSKHWKLKEHEERITTLPLEAFNTLTGSQQREYIQSLLRLGFRDDSQKYRHHLKRLS